MDNMKKRLSQLFCAVMMSIVFCVFLFASNSVFAQDGTGTSGGGWIDPDSAGKEQDLVIDATGTASSTYTQSSSGLFSLIGSYWTGLEEIRHHFTLQNIASTTANEEGRLGLSRDTLELLSVLANGNVGIGTTNPGEKLTVDGIIESTSVGFKFPDGTIQTTAAGGGVLRIGEDGNYYYRNISEQNINENLFVLGNIVTRGAAAGVTLQPRDGTGSAFQFFNQTGDNMSVFGNGSTLFTIAGSGNVGIGLTNPPARLTVNGNILSTGPQAGVNIRPRDGTGSAFQWYNQTGDDIRLFGGGSNLLTVTSSGNVGIGTVSPATKLDVNGTTRTKIIEITGGSDLAEPFDIIGTESIIPGMVVAINPDNPGQLRIADKAYDHTVAGIVSGANGIRPGLVMKQEGTIADGPLPVALTGRVYCWSDATHNPIKPGDLLTTSDIPGHAMKVKDYEMSHGAILGKAMSSLDKGKGLVLVLVSLQ